MKVIVQILAVFALSVGLIMGAFDQNTGEGQNREENQVIHGPNFFDNNGDGFNDNAPDHDNDGIPNGQDFDCAGSGNCDSTGPKIKNFRRSQDR
jgi:hypothetical protein